MSGKPYSEQPALHSDAPYRAALMTQASNFQERLRLAASDPKHAIFGIGQGIPHTFMTKTIASAAPDFIWFDLEHGLWTRETIHDAIQAAKYHSQGKTMTMIRVTKGDESTLANVLDAGADSIINAHTETKEELEHLVKELYYPPMGERSYTPWMAAAGVSDTSLYSNDPFGAVNANKHVALIAQFESVKGVEMADELAALPYVHSILFGPADYCLDAGISMFVDGAPNPALLGAMMKVGAAGVKHGKPAFVGIADPSMTPMLMQAGFRGFFSFLDTMFIATSVQKAMVQGREAAAGVSEQMKAQQP